MPNKPKNKDLAKKLGLSPTLVSLVLNNKGDQHGIKKETQEKVLFLARKMGFFIEKGRVNALPVESKPGIVGMMVPSLNDPFVSDVSPFLHHAFSRIGMGLSIITKETDDERYDRMISAFRRFYSGLILVGSVADDATIRNLKSAGYPFILLEKSVSAVRLNTVCSDREQGAELVKKHVENLGYRNILIITEEKSDKKVLEELIGKLSGIGNLTTVTFTDIAQLEHYLRPPYRVDLILTMESETVYSLMAYLNSIRMRIPNDIALISMNEGLAFDLMTPAVTALKKPLEAMAIKAAKMLWSEIKNSGKGKFVRQVKLDQELIVRASCGSFK